MEIAIIKWTDSTYYKVDFCEIKEELKTIKPKNLYSVGMFVYEDEDCIVITQDFEPDSESARMLLTIPKCSISNYIIKKINIKTLKKKRKGKK